MGDHHQPLQQRAPSQFPSALTETSTAQSSARNFLFIWQGTSSPSVTTGDRARRQTSGQPRPPTSDLPACLSPIGVITTAPFYILETHKKIVQFLWPPLHPPLVNTFIQPMIWAPHHEGSPLAVSLHNSLGHIVSEPAGLVAGRTADSHLPLDDLRSHNLLFHHMLPCWVFK